MIERRTSPRQPKLKAGKVVFNALGAVSDCTVRNVSANGACLIVPDGVPMAPRFRLRTADGMRPCAIAWQRLDRVGVTFN